MKKRLIIIMSVLSLILTLLALPSSSEAAPKGEKEKKKEVVVNKEDAFYNEAIGKYMNAFKPDENGTLVPIGKEEYQSLIEGIEETSSETLPQSQSPEIGTLAFTPDYYSYVRSSTGTYTAPLQKVSASINCTTSSCTVTKSINATYTNSFTAGLTSPEIAAIKANAGFTWAVSASTTSSYSFTITKGQGGYIGFNPYYRKTTGTLYAYYQGIQASAKTVEGRAPKKLSNGELDGVYSFIYN